MRLSRKHRAFVNQYIACYLNATEAYTRVYPKANRESARANAARLLAKASIAQEVQRRIDEACMGPSETLIRLGEQARADYSRYIRPEGVIDLPALIADGKAHLIKAIKETPHGKQIEFHDVQMALQLLGKTHKLFIEKVEADVKGALMLTADDVAAARQAALTTEAELLTQWEIEGGQSADA